MKRIIAFLLGGIFMLGAFSGICNAEGTKKVSTGLKDKEKYQKYIASLVLDNGAVIMNRPSSAVYDADKLPDIDGLKPEEYLKRPSAKIVPYFSEIAIYGLISSDTKKEYKDKAQSFLDWYAAHLNTAQTDAFGVDGTVYDYYVFVDKTSKVPYAEITARELFASQYKNQKDNPHAYDSSDSYAAMYLSLMKLFAQTYDAADYVKSKKDVIDRVKNAMLATYSDRLGLTYAKKNYPMYYLMDNCEVYAGAKDAAYIYREILKDEKTADELKEKADIIASSVENYMYDESKGRYFAAVNGEGREVKFKEDVFYPLAPAQFYPVIFGLPEAQKRKNSVVENFKEKFDTKTANWSKFYKTDAYPWAAVALGLMSCGEFDLPEIFMQTCQTRFTYKGFPHPFYNAEGGFMLWALSLIQDLPEYQPDEESIAPDKEESKLPADESKAEESLKSESETTAEKPLSGGMIALICVGAVAVTAGVIAVILSSKKNKKKAK